MSTSPPYHPTFWTLPFPDEAKQEGGSKLFVWNRFESDNSDDSNDCTPSGNATRGASKRVERYLDGVKAATETAMSPPWELPEAIWVYKIIRKKELNEVM